MTTVPYVKYGLYCFLGKNRIDIPKPHNMDIVYIGLIR